MAKTSSLERRSQNRMNGKDRLLQRWRDDADGETPLNRSPGRWRFRTKARRYLAEGLVHFVLSVVILPRPIFGKLDRSCPLPTHPISFRVPKKQTFSRPYLHWRRRCLPEL